jgi:hypothetical protein
MKLFVLGPSGAGKTPFARQAAGALGLQHVMASEWVRRLFPAGPPYPDRDAFVRAITHFSVEELRRRPDACVDYIRRHFDLSRPTVIEGVRNPHDFVHLFDPRQDRAVFLDHLRSELRRTAFEGGLDVIDGYLRFLQQTGLLPADPPRVWRYQFPDFYDPPGFTGPDCVPQDGARLAASLDAAVRDFLAGAATWYTPPPAGPATDGPPSGPQLVHAEIPPIKTEIRAEYLYDLDPTREGQFLPCTAFAVSSYPGHAPTFKVLLEDGGLFSYIPPTALLDRGKAAGQVMLDLRDLAYDNCASGEICVSRFTALAGRLQAFFKHRNLWLAGEYLCTIDWYMENNLTHLVALENGQYAFVPSHKAKFQDGERALPELRKLHVEWKL